MAGERLGDFFPDTHPGLRPPFVPPGNFGRSQIINADGFSEAALLQAEAIRLTPELFEGRTEVPVMQVAVDGPTTKDRDDVFGVEKIGENVYRLYVSIADVQSVVPIDSPIDQEAVERDFTEYFTDSNLPMIARPLSENLLSLHEGQKRPTMTVSQVIHLKKDSSGELEIDSMEKPVIEQTVSTSAKSLTYSEADGLIQEGSDDLSLMLQDSHILAKALLRNRAKRAAAAGSQAEYDLVKGTRTTEEGIVKAITPENAYVANMIIREFMISTNEAVGKFLYDNNIPVLFRNHLVLGERAFYGPVPRGHKGLGLDSEHPYPHFTSPIRRLADLIAQRQLTAFLNGDPLLYTQQDLERLAIKINERDIVLRQKKVDHCKEIHRAAVQAMYDGDVSKLSTDEFSYVIKLATDNGEINTNMQEAIFTRLATGKPEPIDNNDLSLIIARMPSADITKRIMRILTIMKEGIRNDILGRAATLRGWEIKSIVTETPGKSVVVSMHAGGKVYTSSPFLIEDQPASHKAQLKYARVLARTKSAEDREKYLEARDRDRAQMRYLEARARARSDLFIRLILKRAFIEKTKPN